MPENQAKRNYRYSDEDKIGEGGPKTKYKSNIEAIKVLKCIETENRLATSQEQHVLARYVGWGGLPQAFDSLAKGWEKEYQELKMLLEPKEYERARASTNNAHYTSPEVITAIWKALENFGFQGGNVLEPAMGVGYFYSLIPETMKDAKLYGVELDSLSGRIAKQLYLEADIQVKGFEETDYADNSFDVVVGNVPFGNYKLHDPRYNKHNFLIHDYFIAKSLDKIRSGGIMAVVTSKGTMDKADDTARKYISERADLIGAVRLPNSAFKQIANTEVTCDILFFQKRERMEVQDPAWIGLGQTDDGIPVNQYFLDNPEMMLGTMAWDKMTFGEDSKYTACIAPDGLDLEASLNKAISHLSADITPLKQIEETAKDEIPADPNVKNYTYTLVDGNIYYRENAIMRRMDYDGKRGDRVRAMIGLRQIVRGLITLQVNGCTNAQLHEAQNELNAAYDHFAAKFGSINSRENRRAFRDDDDYCLLTSLEIVDEDGNIEKADIFTKQTIRPTVPITKVATASEALIVSLNIKGCVDIPYMCSIYDVAEEQIVGELKGQIFLNPQTWEEGTYQGYETADEYLSGNVRHKLRIAQAAGEDHPNMFVRNVEALKAVQPEEIEVADIHVKISANWIDIADYEAFVYEHFHTPYMLHRDTTWSSKSIEINYNSFDSSWYIANKSLDKSSVVVTETFGTSRMNAYEIMEASLNQRTAIVRDRIELDKGKYKYVINRKETELAKEKQRTMQEAFRNWIFSDPERREKYTKRYNEKFNSIRLREYDGSHMTFPGMTTDIKFRPHQLNAIARGVYGGNFLLAHAVGAGKTFVMIAIAMERKRLGLANKTCMIVPNHLTAQIGADFLRLYPRANILVATKKDFEKENRKRFVTRIATGAYDAVIIGFSQFEKIPMSKEYQENMLFEQIEGTSYAIAELKEQEGKRYTVKGLERLKKSLEADLKALADESRKDTVMSFEELGFDAIIADEAHNYKNCAIFTKMRNIAGISDVRAKKSFDMLMKTQYINDLTDYKGLGFSTGTPLSNSMTELFVLTRYLRADILEKQGLSHFDNWAALYGETITSLELAPAGNGFRLRQRFAKFNNLPELMTTFRSFADVQTADMLSYLPKPKIRGGKPVIVTAEPSEEQQAKIAELAERSEKIHAGGVDPSIDNALKITHEARLTGTDLRLLDPTASDNPTGKVNLCVESILREYRDTMEERGAQIVFCDVGTPKPGERKFTIYQYLKDRLMEEGIPEHEIAFAHDANNEVQRTKQFADIRNGKIRVIIASTAKMGTGANIQDRLVALHNLDIPWRPSDLEQRIGRILRQGNQYDEVAIYNYVTKGTFDAYMWSILENKQRFISQIMTSKTVARSCEDIDETVLSYAEIKAIATGDPRIKEKMEVDMEVLRLRTLQSAYNSQRFSLQDKINFAFPKKLERIRQEIECITKDIEKRDIGHSNEFEMTIGGKIFDERQKAGERILLLIENIGKKQERNHIGTYMGFDMMLDKNTWGETIITLKGSGEYELGLGDNVIGNMSRIDNVLKGLDQRLKTNKSRLETIKNDLRQAKLEIEKPFSHQEKLDELLRRQAELEAELDLNKKDELISDDELVVG